MVGSPEAGVTTVVSSDPSRAQLGLQALLFPCVVHADRQCSAAVHHVITTVKLVRSCCSNYAVMALISSSRVSGVAATRQHPTAARCHGARVAPHARVSRTTVSVSYQEVAHDTLTDSEESQASPTVRAAEHDRCPSPVGSKQRWSI